MEVAPIEFSDDGRRHRLKIGDVIEIEVEYAASHSIWMVSRPGSVGPGTGRMTR